ncbi:MAG TPA: SOS response-associated peptidase [Nitriliruptorales bacterium]
MCGRFTSFSDPDQLAQFFQVDEVATSALPERYNVAPTQEVYAVIERDAKRALGTLRWGLVPFWAPDPKGAPAPINARIESLLDKQFFRDPFERRRCLLPADGFYEWRQTGQLTEKGKPKKQPYYIHRVDGKPLAFAGIWSSWRARDDPDAPPLYTCAIVTRDAVGPVMKRLHDRMPVALPEEAWERWLDVEDTDAQALVGYVIDLAPPELDAYPVTTRVNNVRNEGPELLARDESA